jgi:hypothetical protein
METVRTTAEALQGTLTQMRAVEEMRQTLRDIRDLPKGDVN